jgi:DNA-binding protein H-NS
MDINLEDMSLDELKALHKDLTKAISNYEARKKRQAAHELAELAEQHGYSLAELLESVNTKRKPVAPKYRHRENHELTWTGRGRKPAWFEDAELIE